VNILYLCAFCPDPVSDGDRVRAKWTLSVLARRHKVYGFFLDPGGRGRLAPSTRGLLAGAEVFPVAGRALAAGVVRALLSGKSAHAYAFRSGAAVRRLGELLRRWPVEAAFVHRLRMMPYAEGVGMPIALDLTDSLGSYYRRGRWSSPVRALYSFWERRKLARYEVWSANRSRVVFAVSSREAGEMRAAGVTRPVVAAPNGVDCRFWSFAPRTARAGRLGFMGNLGYPPNREGLAWFAREVAPRLAGATAGRPVTVIGGGRAGSLARMRGPRGPVFGFTGFVPDPRPLFRGMAAFICPLPVALGIQNKALDAMAAGVPVVATSNVARGIGAVPGREIMAADSAAGFASAVRRVIERPRDAALMARRARRFVVSRFGEPVAARTMEAGLDTLERAVARQ